MRPLPYKFLPRYAAYSIAAKSCRCQNHCLWHTYPCWLFPAGILPRSFLLTLADLGRLRQGLRPICGAQARHIHGSADTKPVGTMTLTRKPLHQNKLLRLDRISLTRSCVYRDQLTRRGQEWGMGPEDSGA